MTVSVADAVKLAPVTTEYAPGRTALGVKVSVGVTVNVKVAALPGVVPPTVIVCAPAGRFVFGIIVP